MSLTTSTLSIEGDTVVIYTDHPHGEFARGYRETSRVLLSKVITWSEIYVNSEHFIAFVFRFNSENGKPEQKIATIDPKQAEGVIEYLKTRFGKPLTDL